MRRFAVEKLTPILNILPGSSATGLVESALHQVVEAD